MLFRKNFTLLLTLLILGLLVAACGSAQPAAAPAEESAAEAPAAEEAAPAGDEEIIVGLITKTETNPFFVKMKEGAQAKVDELGASLLTAAGSFDGDNAAQVTAIE